MTHFSQLQFKHACPLHAMENILLLVVDVLFATNDTGCLRRPQYFRRLIYSTKPQRLHGDLTSTNSVYLIVPKAKLLPMFLQLGSGLCTH